MSLLAQKLAEYEAAQKGNEVREQDRPVNKEASERLHELHQIFRDENIRESSIELGERAHIPVETQFTERGKTIVIGEPVLKSGIGAEGLQKALANVDAKKAPLGKIYDSASPELWGKVTELTTISVVGEARRQRDFSEKLEEIRLTATAQRLVQENRARGVEESLFSRGTKAIEVYKKVDSLSNERGLMTTANVLEQSLELAVSALQESGDETVNLDEFRSFSQNVLAKSLSTSYLRRMGSLDPDKGEIINLRATLKSADAHPQVIEEHVALHLEFQKKASTRWNSEELSETILGTAEDLVGRLSSDRASSRKLKGPEIDELTQAAAGKIAKQLIFAYHTVSTEQDPATAKINQYSVLEANIARTIHGDLENVAVLEIAEKASIKDLLEPKPGVERFKFAHNRKVPGLDRDDSIRVEPNGEVTALGVEEMKALVIDTMVRAVQGTDFKNSNQFTREFSARVNAQFAFKEKMLGLAVEDSVGIRRVENLIGRVNVIRENNNDALPNEAGHIRMDTAVRLVAAVIAKKTALEVTPAFAVALESPLCSHQLPEDFEHVDSGDRFSQYVFTETLTNVVGYVTAAEKNPELWKDPTFRKKFSQSVVLASYELEQADADYEGKGVATTLLEKPPVPKMGKRVKSGWADRVWNAH